MARYIDVDEFLKKNWYGNAKPIVYRSYAADLIKSIPTADVVEIVRCKDCERYKRVGDKYYCSLLNLITKKEDYCSRARKYEYNELKPCPICGRAVDCDEMRVSSHGKNTDYKAKIKCECGLTFEKEWTEIQAVDRIVLLSEDILTAWNKRKGE